MGHPFREEGIFLTLCTCPTSSKSLFHHVMFNYTFYFSITLFPSWNFFRTLAFHKSKLWRVFVWQLETQLFASSYIWLAYIFELSYSMVVTSVSEKSSVNQPEFEKKLVSHCQMYMLVKNCWIFCHFYYTYENSKYFVH